MKSRWLYLVGLFLCCATLALAEQTITGTVTDKSDAVIANAKVTVTFRDTNTPTSTVTTTSGDFAASNLKVGVYTVTIEAKGFKTYKRENIQLDADQKYRLDARMELGTESSTVIVNAEATQLRTDSSALTYNITLKDLQDLPFFNIGTSSPNLGGSPLRDPYAVAQMLPGVRYNRDNNVMLINGLPADQVQYRIDGQVTGLSSNRLSPGTGFAMSNLTYATQPSPDAIEEIAITTSNYSAEFGSVGGALFNVTMKSGTNQFHGSAYDYTVNEFLNSLQSNAPTNGVAKTQATNRRNNWGFTIGGPVKIPHVYDGTNKTFFFWSLDYLKLTRKFPNTLSTMPTDAYRTGDFGNLFSLAGNQVMTLAAAASCTLEGISAAPCNVFDPLGNTVRLGQLFNPGTQRTVTCDKTVAPNSLCASGAVVSYADPLLNNNLANASITDPTTGLAYSGLQAVDPVALKLMSYLPKATDNTVATNNYSLTQSNSQTNRIPSLKLDHNINASSRISLTMQETVQSQPKFQDDGLPFPITQTVASELHSPQIRLNYDQTLTPTLQFHLGGGWLMTDLTRQSQGDFDPADPVNGLGFTNTLTHRYFPRFDLTSQTVAPAAFGGMTAVGINTGSLSLNLERHPSGNTSLTWIHGSHTIKFGFDWRMAMLPYSDPSFADGHFAFSLANSTGVTGQPFFTQGASANPNQSTSTGMGFANLMLGAPGSGVYGMRRPITYRESNFQYGAYVQDSYRATRKLTLDLGIRWDMGTYTREDHGYNGSLSLSTINPTFGNRLGAVVYEHTCGCNLAANYPYGIGPRVGFAYTLNPKTVFRGGFGMSYGSVGEFGAYPPNSNPFTATSAPYQPAFLMRDGVPNAALPPTWPSYSSSGGQATNSLALPLQLLDQNAGRPSRTLQWNLGIQRELSRSLVMEVSYVGNRGVWQSGAQLENLNNLGQNTLINNFGFDPYNPANFALLTNGNYNALSAADKSTLATHGIVLPFAGFPTANSVLSQLRPYPQWGGSALNPQRAPLGKSWYDALQISLNKRYSHGLMVNANYSLSKNLATTAPIDYNNPNYNNKDLSQNNIPQQIRVTFQYQTPRPPKWVPVMGQRWVAYALEGWGVSMSLRYQGGFYLGRPNCDATQSITSILASPGYQCAEAQLKTDANGAPMNPWSVNWYDLSGNHHTDPIDINCHCYDPERTVVLNPAAWTAVPNLSWPSQTQIIPNFRGPRQPSESGNISRTFRLGKEGRINLNIRAEFQNIFNRSLLPTTVTLGDFQVATITKTAVGINTAGFGTLGQGYGTARTGTLVGRLTF